MGSTTNTMQLVALLSFLVAILSSNFVAAQSASSNSSQPGTNLVEINVTQPTKQSDDTVRVDPLDNFNKYRGGFDITNKHYWSSTVFTGVYGYVIGIVWLLVGIIYGAFLLVTPHSCKARRNGKLKRRSPCHKQCYLWPVLLAVLFTILALTASGLVLGGNERFHSKAKTVVDIIIDTANGASETMYNTTGAMKEIRDGLGTVNGSTAKASAFLTSTSERLDAGAADIQRQARKNRRLIDKGLKIVYIISTVIVSLNLTAVIALSVCGILRLQRTFKMLIVLCWFLTALCWIFFGIYFFLNEFSSDTCTALENFQQDPYNNSLSSILPCDELLAAKPVLDNVSEGIYNLVNQVNANISVLQGSNPNGFYVCNPFSAPPEYKYQPDNCPTNTIRIGNIPEVLKSFTCSDSNNGTCNSGQFISERDYRTVESLTTSIQSLLNVYPGMENLVECQSVKDAFSLILSKHCKPLKKYVHMVWASMVFLSLVMVFLVLIWATKSQHEQEQHSLDGSVKPHSSVEKEMESAETDTNKKKDNSRHSSV